MANRGQLQCIATTQFQRRCLSRRVDLHDAFEQLQPAKSSWRQRVRAHGLGLRPTSPDAYRRSKVQYALLLNSVCDQTWLSRSRLQGPVQQLVARWHLIGIGMQPDLKEMSWHVRRRIALGVAYAGAGTDELRVASMEQSPMTTRIGMLQRAGQHECEDVEVIVRMLRKSGATGYHIFVDDPQGTEAHSGRVIEAAKRERVVRVEPTSLGSAPCMPVMEKICHRSILQGAAPNMDLWRVRPDVDRLSNTGHPASGFVAPESAPPILNTLKVAAGVPVKFILGGNKDLTIFAQGYPAPRTVSCRLGWARSVWSRSGHDAQTRTCSLRMFEAPGRA